MREATVPFSVFRDELSSYIDRCSRRGERIVITRHSREEAVLLSKAEWDEIEATMRVLADPALFRQIVESQRDLEAGRHRPAEDVFADLDREP